MRSRFILPLVLIALASPTLAQDADPAAGKSAFAPCSACHDVNENPRNRMGPYLTGVVGRKAAAVEGFTYSKAMIAAAAAGLVWTPEALEGFLAGPHDYVPGTKMPNVRIRDATARANVIAYLTGLSPDFDPATQSSTYTPPGEADAASAAPSSAQ